MLCELSSDDFCSFIIIFNIPVANTQHAGLIFCATFAKKKKNYARRKTTALIKSVAHFITEWNS